MKDFFRFHKDLDEAKLMGNSIKLFGQKNRSVKELSMRKKFKAGVQRALVGPSTKKKPLMFRTMGKDAKAMQKKSDILRAVGDQEKNKSHIIKHVANKLKTEDTNFKVEIDGLPTLYMKAKTRGELKKQLRKIVKQPSLIKDVDRIEVSKVKKAYRDKSQGRDVKEYTYDYGTPESVKLMKKVTPGEKEEGYVSMAQQRAVWATRKDGGKGHPDNKKKKKK